MSAAQTLAEMSDNQLMSWLADHRQSLHSEMATLRALAKPIRERVISVKTLDQYREDFTRVERAGSVLAASGSRASFYKLRAASERVLADRIYDALAKADRIRKRDAGTISDLLWARSVMDELMPLGDQFAAFAGEKWSASRATPKERTHRQRHKLGRLPADWRERLWTRTGKGKYADAVAVAAVAGVRPAELERGVTVRVLDDGRLAFVVSGAKVKAAANGKAAQGQKARAFAIEVPAGDPMAEHLRRIATGKAKIVRVAVARDLSSAFCKASKLAFPKMSAPPSLYAFRHAFCASAKESGLTPEQVAQVMGHASTASQGHYGMRQQGSGGWKVEPIGSAPTPIRIAAPKPPPPSRTPPAIARREARELAASIPTTTARPRAPQPRI